MTDAKAASAEPKAPEGKKSRAASEGASTSTLFHPQKSADEASGASAEVPPEAAKPKALNRRSIEED